jgi:uncharacterized repeat protein (TIGR01451 family)
MRSKKVLPFCIILFVLSGLLVNAVFAMPIDPEKEIMPVESMVETKPGVVQENDDYPESPSDSLPDQDFSKTSSYYDVFGPMEQMHQDVGSLAAGDVFVQANPEAANGLTSGLDINSIPTDKITIDMAFDVVIGWVDPYQTVSVTAPGYSGYGFAVADAIGFFWTPIWHTSDGHSLGISCGWPIEITSEGETAFTLSPKCLTSSNMDVSTDTISGGIDGMVAGVEVSASLGSFLTEGYWQIPPVSGAPTVTTTTDASGNFSTSLPGVDLGAESLVALDFEQDGVNIRNYVTPQNVFFVHQMNAIGGYADIDQSVSATVYEGTSTTVRWSGSTTASEPFGFYSLENVPIETGDTISVSLDGGSTLTTTVSVLGNFSFDASANTMHGEAVDGAAIRTSLWQKEGELRTYSEAHDTADSSGFDITFSADLKAYEDVLVVLTDVNGNQIQITSGPPYVLAVQNPNHEYDCVVGRMHAPDQPLFVTLDKGDGEVYVRETGTTSDVGNGFSSGCFVIRAPDWSWGPIKMDPGDIATYSNGSGWSQSVEVIGFEYSWNTATNTFSGQNMPAGEVVVTPYNWQNGLYPSYASTAYQVEVVDGDYSVTFPNFDIRDGQSIELTHYNSNGMGNLYNTWSTLSLPYFELQLHHNAIDGMVIIPDDAVTASLYESASATEPIFTTNQDDDGNPYYFWIGDLGGYLLEPGMRVELSSASGWSAEMIVPDLSISGDYVLDTINGSGPQGLLLVEAQREDQSLGLFIPTDNSSAVYLQTDHFGFDLRQGDTVSLTYQALDGNRARQEVRIGDLYYVGHWFNMENRDWMWGEAVPGATVTISVNGGAAIPTYFEDGSCPSCWGIHEPIEINPGDEITIVVDTGFSLTYTVPDPLTAIADSDDDIVSGQIGGRANDWVNIQTWWDGMDYEVPTDSGGSFILQTDSEVTINVPRGGEGHISFNEIPSDTRVEFNQYFRTPDLMLDIFPEGDFIQGVYESGHAITLEVYDNTETLKATATMTSGDMTWGNGLTGFDTNISEDVWDAERPDIIPGDHILGWVDAESYSTSQYTADARVGAITGAINVDNDSISGTVFAEWLITDPPEEIGVECYGWGAPGGAPDKYSSVIPDGEHFYWCGWNPDDEWDVDYNQEIGVAYREPEGHRIFGVYNEPSYDLFLNVNYGHDWIEFWYPPNYEGTLTVTESDGTTIKATVDFTTTVVPWWGGDTGFITNLDGVVWDPERPDIQSGDWVFGEIDVDGTTYSAEVHLGEISGEIDIETNTITGTIDAPWLPQDVEVEVRCNPYDGAPPETGGKNDLIYPNGTDPYYCEWDPDTEWDIQPNNQIGVYYQDPANQWIINVFTAYTDELILSVHYDHEWISGMYEAGHDVHLEILDSLGDEKAHIDLVTGYVDGWGSTTGFDTNMKGANWIPSQPDIQPGDTIHGEVDDGSEFTADVQIGWVTADLDLDNDQVSGTVDAEGLPQSEEVKVRCEIWDWNSPPNKEDWVLPNGTDTYLCDWTDDGYDLNETSNLMVGYFDPAGHNLIGDFRYPAPRLRIEKWLEGGEPGEGGVATFNIQYRNEGDATALNTIIIDTFELGLTYISDTSGLPKTVDGNQVVWTLGSLDPGEQIEFKVFAHVDAVVDEDVINTATISSDTPDSGNPEDRTRTWQGTVIANDTHLNVGKDTWTWNPAPGQNFVYRINVCNNGPTGSTELTLIDTLPDAVTYGFWWGREAGWEEISSAGNTLSIRHPSIPGWSCYEVYIQVTLDPEAQENAELINTAQISATNDLETDDNQTTLYHNVGAPYVDLSVNLNWHSGSLVPGGQYRYGIYFRNDGNMSVPGPIEVSTTLPAGTSFGGWDHWDWASVGDPVIDGNTVTWPVDDLDPGYSGVIEVFVNIDQGTAPGTVLVHNANIEVQEGEDYTDNNTASFSETLRDHGPNLRIRKWGDWHGHGEGHNAWYQLQVENIGDQTVYDVVVTDYYPEEVVLDGGIGVNYWEEWSWQDDQDMGIFTINLNRLEPGWNVGINFNVVIPGDDPIPNGFGLSNTATVSPTENDSYIEDNTTSFDLTYTGGPKPNLHIDKWLTSGEPGVGGNAVFHVQYLNQGGAVATGVELIDTLVGMTYISDTSGITPTVNGSEITWVIGEVEPGDWIHFDVFVHIDANVGDLLQNTIEITTTSPYLDGDPSERISHWEGQVIENDTHLSVGKDTWTWNPAPGQNFVYSISVCNNGNTASSTLTLTETLPENTTYQSWFPRGGEPEWTEISHSEHSLVLEQSTISSWSCYEVYVQVLLDLDAQPGDLISNTASIEALTDLSEEDDIAILEHNVGEPYADLAIWTNFNWGSLTPGGHYRSILQFRNQGNLGLSPSDGVYVTATIPTGTTFFGWDKWDWGTVEDPVVTGNEVSWRLTDLDPGMWGIIELWLDINPETEPGTELVNQVSISEQIGETDIENNSASYSEFVWGHGPNLRIRKTGGWAGSYEDGQYAWYRLELENIGDETVENVEIRDDFPTDMTFTDTLRVGHNGNWSWDNSHLGDHYFIAYLDRLEPGWRANIDFDTRIPWETLQEGASYENNASIDPRDNDVNPLDNDANLILTAGPDFYIMKSLQSGEFLPGETLTYRFDFGNQRSEYLLGLNMSGNAVITDTLPEGMSYVSGSANLHWWGQEWVQVEPTVDGQSLTWTFGPLEVDQSHELVYAVDLADGIDPGSSYVNVVTVTSTDPDSDVDPFLENNTSSYDPEVEFGAPLITSLNSSTFRVNSYYSFTVTASGSPTPQLTYTGALPAGIGFVDNGDGTATLSGTASVGAGGVYNLTFTADNGINPDATQSFTLTVQEAPRITSLAYTTFEVGQSGSFTISTAGYPTVYDITCTGSLPDGVTLTDNNDGTATLSGTPSSLQGGVYNLTLTAINGVSPNGTQSFVLTVNEAPLITSANTTTFISGVLGDFMVTTTGYPTPSLSYTGPLPTGITFTDNGDGTASISGTTTQEGTYEIKITATNYILPDAQQDFTIEVTPPLSVPVITSPDTTTFTVGTPGSFTVIASGNPSPTFSYTGSLPDAVTLTSAGLLSGTPAEGTGGVYVITITATNGVEPDDTQIFTLVVNEAPQFTSESSTIFTGGELGSFTVITTGYPAPVITTDDGLPTWLTLVDQGDGTAILSGTPPDENGVDYFLLKAANGVTPDAQQSFTLTWVKSIGHMIYLPLILR